MRISQGVGRSNMPGLHGIFAWSPIMRMKRASRSHETVGGAESVPAGGLGPLYRRTRWHASTKSMMSYFDRLQRRNLLFYIRYGCMPIPPLRTLTSYVYHRHRTWLE